MVTACFRARFVDALAAQITPGPVHTPAPKGRPIVARGTPSLSEAALGHCTSNLGSKPSPFFTPRAHQQRLRRSSATASVPRLSKSTTHALNRVPFMSGIASPPKPNWRRSASRSKTPSAHDPLGFGSPFGTDFGASGFAFPSSGSHASGAPAFTMTSRSVTRAPSRCLLSSAAAMNA